MLDFVNNAVSFSDYGPLPNVFAFLKPFASLAGDIADLIGLLPK